MKTIRNFISLTLAALALAILAVPAVKAAQSFVPAVNAPVLVLPDLAPAPVLATVPVPTAILAEATTPASPFTDPSTLPSPLASIIALVTPVLIWTVKLLVPKINTRWLPLIAGVVGLLLALGSHYFAGLDVTWWQGILLGGLGVWLRELVDQLRQPAHTVASNDQLSSG